MKTTHNRSFALGKVAIASLLAVSSVTSSPAINVVLSGTLQPGKPAAD
jgi:hypothetical protein